jgi:hypothetical protein
MFGSWARAQGADDPDGEPAPPPAAAAKEDLPAEASPEASELSQGQRQVSERFRELEKLLLRMAELTAPTDPRRAALLRQAVAVSNERDIDGRFEELVKLLRDERLSAAVKGQGQVREDLHKLLELLLSEDRTKRIENEKQRIREYLKRVNKIIKEQKGVQGETARDGDPRKLADRQSELADETGKIADDLKGEDAKNQSSELRKDADDYSEPSDRDSKDRSEKSKSKDGEPAGDKDQPPGKNDQGKSDQGTDDQGKEKDKSGEKDADGAKPADEQSKKDADDTRGTESKSAKDKPADNPEGAGGNSQKSPDKDSPQPGPRQNPPGGDEPQSNEPQPNPTQKRLEQAQKRMQEAREKLDEAKRRDATEKQAEALKELEQAKAELEEILRQLREEEMARTLAMLETRFRKMLDAQVEVYEGTKRLDKVAEAERDRDDEIEAGRLSRNESQIAIEADKALVVLREEGSAVAFPEAVMEMRDDMNQIARRLSETKVGDVTQGIEKDVIAALEEMIASLKKAQKDMDEKSKQAQQAESGESEEPLVDTLAELRMIRALQMRVNNRTQRYAEMTKTEQTEVPELIEALRRLAEREQRIHKVTRDIVVGRNR